MKVLISDYAELIEETSHKERQHLLEIQPDWEVEIYPYSNNPEELVDKMNQSDALMTAFLPLDEEILNKMYTIKCISINATGYNTVDIAAATKKGIAVMAIDEYCTVEVAEHTMSLILALGRGLKKYIKELEVNQRWHYSTAGRLRRLRGQKIGIFGFGRIGRQVAELAKGFGMEVYAYQDGVHGSDGAMEAEEVHFTGLDEICSQCSVITNHMSQNAENHHFFNWQFFSKLEQNPVFINVGRGDAVQEDDLLRALNENILSGAALDVQAEENPDLENNPFLKRDNVIITPHAAFYSEESIEALVRISTDNIVHYMDRSFEKVKRIINPQVIKEEEEK